MGASSELRGRRRRFLEFVAANHLGSPVSARTMLGSSRASGPQGDRCRSSLGCGERVPTAFPGAAGRSTSAHERIARIDHGTIGPDGRCGTAGRTSRVDTAPLSAAADHHTRPHGRLRVSRWGLLLAGSPLVPVAPAAVLTARWLSAIKTTSLARQLSATPLGIELRVQSGDVAVLGGSQSGLSISRSGDQCGAVLEAVLR